ncbi:osteopetrosis-associated transmembrane protein 1 [Halyomorpha halys]|uniref:osteopetrosis-associated transmembrane protein 1 n=1 Tax=Halyomorpha halys TaxID=286706 RepID=UPI0006D4ECCB|nr:osteopetrosis-associated transmembrane protein 1 [Halyomorpha halys]
MFSGSHWFTLMTILITSWNSFCFSYNGANTDMMKLELSSSCEEMLISFATLSGNFTYCAIKNARPIKLCQDCVSIYIDVKNIYYSILHIEDFGGDSCRDKLTNLDRLQVVESGFDYADKLWSRAFCDSCFVFEDKKPPELKPVISEILNISAELNQCIYNSPNDTCKKCEKQYLTLNEIYNNMRADTGQNNFCMDIVDLMNTTRGNWSGVWGCCNDRKKPETTFLSISSGVLVSSLLFYALLFTFTRKTEHPVIPQKRWKQKFTRRVSVSSSINS